MMNIHSPNNTIEPYPAHLAFYTGGGGLAVVVTYKEPRRNQHDLRPRKNESMGQNRFSAKRTGSTLTLLLCGHSSKADYASLSYGVGMG